MVIIITVDTNSIEERIKEDLVKLEKLTKSMSELQSQYNDIITAYKSNNMNHNRYLDNTHFSEYLDFFKENTKYIIQNVVYNQIKERLNGK